MGQQDVYKLTRTRATDEIESDDLTDPITKRVLAYLWDGSDKVRLACDASGKVVVAI